MPPFSTTQSVNILDLPVSPLLFLSGKFNGSQLKWHISQKEIYPIIFAFVKAKHLLMTSLRTINIFTDHRSLLHIFDPTVSKNKNHNERLLRWTLIIQQVRTRFFHISSDDNILCDLLSR